MKPLVIFLDESEKDKVTLKKAQLQKLLEDAYKSGYDDGYSNGFQANSYKYWWNNTNITDITTPLKYTNTTPNTVPDYTHITCEAHNTTGD